MRWHSNFWLEQDSLAPWWGIELYRDDRAGMLKAQQAGHALTMEGRQRRCFSGAWPLRLHGFTRVRSKLSRVVPIGHLRGFGQELQDIALLEAQDRVVVVCEQGIGDILQFIPFAAELEARDCSVIIAGSPRLETLITSAIQ